MLCRTLFLLAAAFSMPVMAGEGLGIRDGWIRAAPPGATMLAGYATLVNTGATPVTVVGARSTAFGEVSLHTTTLIDGVARMRPVGALPIAPGASASLAPGGHHLMLMAPSQPMTVGTGVEIELVLQSGETIPGRFTVRDADAVPADHAHSH
ncbi:copper chaperone PCu(A)C [Tahibacter amnicola]|uniref:Copper chaperone PCu(A)C n=1 Tax=Tahibacter amnicola TaxID=2976241 RepID=A0ABY6BFQ3_9GAMM|nr:copper chaperone PCu(A)C [Tahibacter amnicola]UXI67195.1 copper chaperone PCu(A)C [Tahibacter amnicola]